MIPEAISDATICHIFNQSIYEDNLSSQCVLIQIQTQFFKGHLHAKILRY